MWTWIPVGHSASYEEPAEVRRVLNGFGSVRGLSGGTKRAPVLEALQKVAPHDVVWSLPDDAYMDGLVRNGSIGVCLELGRAHTNKGGLYAVLRAAMDPSVSTLILVAPTTYKNGRAAEPMIRDIRDVVSSRGVMLDLYGVAVVPY